MSMNVVCLKYNVKKIQNQGIFSPRIKLGSVSYMATLGFCVQLAVQFMDHVPS